ncbi:ribonuclease HI [Streptomyces sp. LP05-1]|uniref:Ribonuclease H n=1 Tax=Streptomyces pyxinae TaxID=2970734 RepID=A0ABT2CMM7_9ACTN|nr:ribonuclease H [Streptomyces sp. LP05-1]MCS0638678.1 ribonuclease HI [Streptomyces sp. LP05-1]
MVERIIAACDGACKGNPGPAAWAWVVADADGRVATWEAGPLGRATNNVAELTALRELLAATDPAVPLEVRMDSQYAMKAVTTWLPGWRRKGWKTAAGTPVANKDLVVAIDGLLAGREVDFVYVPAHQVGGDALNAAADGAASHAARTQEAIGSATGSELPPPDAEPRPAAGARRSAGSGSTRRSGPAKSGSARGTISAKFPGRCRCGKPYGKGEKIAKNPDGWGHPDCASAATPAD